MIGDGELSSEGWLMKPVNRQLEVATKSHLLQKQPKPYQINNKLLREIVTRIEWPSSTRKHLLYSKDSLILSQKLLK